MTVPTGLSVSGGPITSSGTLAISYASGYSIPTDAKQADWDAKSDFSGSFTDLTNVPSITLSDTKYAQPDYTLAGIQIGSDKWNINTPTSASSTSTSTSIVTPTTTTLVFTYNDNTTANITLMTGATVATTTTTTTTLS